LLNRISGIDQESLLADSRRDPVPLHFAWTCMQTMRARISKDGKSRLRTVTGIH
jgi:hypothetical protein